MSLKNTSDINGFSQITNALTPPNKEEFQLLRITNRIVREDECKFISGLSRTSRWEKEKKGEFPKRIQVSGRAIGWRIFDLMDWLEGLSDAK